MLWIVLLRSAARTERFENRGSRVGSPTFKCWMDFLASFGAVSKKWLFIMVTKDGFEILTVEHARWIWNLTFRASLSIDLRYLRSLLWTRACRSLSQLAQEGNLFIQHQGSLGRRSAATSYDASAQQAFRVFPWSNDVMVVTPPKLHYVFMNVSEHIHQKHAWNAQVTSPILQKRLDCLAK